MKTAAEELGEALAKDLDLMSDKAQSDLAEMLGVSQQTVSNWKTGKHLPRLTKLNKLHDVFGLNSNTGKALEHIKPRALFFSHAGTDDNLALVDSMKNARRSMPKQTLEGLAARSNSNTRNLHAHGMGNQAGSTDNETQREDTTDLEPRAEHETMFNIKSFEVPHHATNSEMIEALNRAQSGVQLARQVLDDASNQISRALSQLSK